MPTSGRRVGRVNFSRANTGAHDGRIELDRNTDVFVARRNYISLHCPERFCYAITCSDDHEVKTNINVAQVATGCTTASGDHHALVTNEALCVLELENSLMSLDQLRDCGVQDQDNPHSLDPMIIENYYEGEELIACLKSERTIFFRCLDSFRTRLERMQTDCVDITNGLELS